MKKGLIFLLTGCFVCLFWACQPDPCEGLVCLNGGICEDGRCDCPEGFIGTDCGIQLDPCEQKDCVEAQTDSCRALDAFTAFCECKTGFEGDRCQDRWEDKYVGNYQCVESCDSTNALFDVSIQVGPDPQQITFVRFHNQVQVDTMSNTVLEAKVVAKLLGSGLFQVDEQFMFFGRVSGAGSLATNGEIQFFYRIIQDTDTLECNSILSPK